MVAGVSEGVELKVGSGQKRSSPGVTVSPAWRPVDTPCQVLLLWQTPPSARRSGLRGSLTTLGEGGREAPSTAVKARSITGGTQEASWLRSVTG